MTLHSKNQKITPFLWFDTNAEEAMKFYTSIFKNSGIIEIKNYGKVGPGDTDVVTGTFILEGQQFMALNGGPLFKFNESISFFIECEDQAEVDYYWNTLVDGGQESQCGWLKDKFGVSWQVVPKRLGELLNDTDPQKAGRAMQAMLQMQKIDVAKLEEAAATL